MTPPATRLIVALDVPPERADDLATVLSRETSFFKIGPALLLDRNGYGVAERIVRLGLGLFLDLKHYDTRDTVDRTVRRAFDLGARFVTVHATPSVMEAAMRAKPADPRCKVLAVGPLTDAFYNSSCWAIYEEGLAVCDGIICPSVALASFRMGNGARREKARDKILVTPGIRPDGYAAVDNHRVYTTPAKAVRYGADYLVVGRPIIAAPDPVVATRRIIAEIEAACTAPTA